MIRLVKRAFITLMMLLSTVLSTAILALAYPAYAANCSGVPTTIEVHCGTGNPIFAYARAIIQFVAGIFGLVAVLMIIIAGFQYMTSAGNPDAIKKAKSRIANVILSIILFALMFAILQYLLPGGVF